MERLNVALGDRAYPIYIGSGVCADAKILKTFLRQLRVAVVTNTTVAALYLPKFREAMRAQGIDCAEIILPDGEEFKNWQTLNSIFDVLVEKHCERSTTLVALGGGVVGDMTGFAAACFQRGMPFIQIPTTLLSQVDSSIGGKTAINHPRGKNMIGAFYQPRLVLIDTDFLGTLPGSELRSGLAEIIKCALIRDLPFLEWLETHLERLLECDQAALEYAITRACQNKAEVVVADEQENGERALLNLGHTFGHAIEAGLGFGKWLHGEAVAAGTLMAAELSLLLGWIEAEDVKRVESIFLRAGLPVRGPALGVARYMELMRSDKKVQDGKLRLILLSSIGKAVIHDGAHEREIMAAINKRSEHV
jgi:3-dehydroquinate synthase